MSRTPVPARHAVRNIALLDAERERAVITRDAEIEYSETVTKLREAFEADLAEAHVRRVARILPAHRAYNAAVIAAERACAHAHASVEIA